MAPPRIFISSTCYDLRYIRENLKYFIRNLGYDPVLSEEGAVFYDPDLHVQDACLAEVPACQIFVLIIGGRYGGQYKDTDRSITNAEYLEAVKAKVPIFALVERGVYDQYRVYRSNKDNPDIDPTKITYPSVDSTNIFGFIEEVQTQTVNNALVPFSDFEEMQSYLRQQWASMMYRFLTSESEAKRFGDTLSAISQATEKIEFFTRQVVKSVGDPTTNLKVEFYEMLLSQSFIQDLIFWGLKPIPDLILQNETLDEFCGNQIVLDKSKSAFEDSEDSITHGGPPFRLTSTERLQRNRDQYIKIRSEFLEKIKEKGLKVEEFLSVMD